MAVERTPKAIYAPRAPEPAMTDTEPVKISRISVLFAGVAFAFLALSAMSFLIYDPLYMGEEIDSGSMGILYAFIGLVLLLILSFIGTTPGDSD